MYLKNSLFESFEPNQSKNCHDNFIDIDFDLINALFISRSNDESFIDLILHDR